MDEIPGLLTELHGSHSEEQGKAAWLDFVIQIELDACFLLHVFLFFFFLSNWP